MSHIPIFPIIPKELYTRPFKLVWLLKVSPVFIFLCTFPGVGIEGEITVHVSVLQLVSSWEATLDSGEVELATSQIQDASCGRKWHIYWPQRLKNPYHRERSGCVVDCLTASKTLNERDCHHRSIAFNGLQFFRHTWCLGSRTTWIDLSATSSSLADALVRSASFSRRWPGPSTEQCIQISWTVLVCDTLLYGNVKSWCSF